MTTTDMAVVIDAIKDKPVQDFVYAALNEIDQRFWTDPASSTGKYHPQFDLGEGGLVRHTIACAAFIAQGLRRYGAYDLLPLALAAAVLHDGWKNGHPWGRHTHPQHGPIGAERIRSIGSAHPDIADSIDKIAYAVEWHYGIWSEKKEAGPTPIDFIPGDGQHEHAVLALVLQEADYYASRRFIEKLDDDKLKAVFA